MEAEQLFAFRFLRWFCPTELLEEIEGDLVQKYEKDKKTHGESRAKRRLLWSTIRFLRPEIILRRKVASLNTGNMLLNNIQFSLRHLGKRKSTTLIHIGGLTLGISVSLFIGIFIHHELSFDSYHPYPDKTYRVNSVWKETEKQFNLYATSTLLAQSIKELTPGVKHVARALPQFSGLIEVTPAKRLMQEHILIVDPQFIDIFHIDILSGDAHKVLATPYQAIVSEATAHKFFGIEDPIGKTFKYRNEFNITVAGVMRDMPSNTSLPATILLSFVDDEKFISNGDTWYFGDFAWVKLQACTFIVMDEAQSTLVIESSLKAIATQNINESPNLDDHLHGDFELQPLKEIHLDNARFGGGPWVKSVGANWLWFFGAIGTIVLLLACINFLNLSIAHAITRTKEIGIRKVIGARRRQLIIQLLTETLLITLAAGVVAILLVVICNTTVNNLLDLHFNVKLLLSPVVLGVLFVLLILLGLLAGLYPAWITSRMESLGIAKLGLTRTPTSWVRQGLVVTQFIVSAVLFISVLLIARQVRYVHEKDLGFEKENILQLPIADAKNSIAFLNQVRMIAGVKDASLSRTAPISNDHWWNTISKDETSDRQSVCAIYGDEHFYSVYNLRLLSGRIPTPAQNDTIRRVVVNEKLLEALKLGSIQDAIGRRFWWGGSIEIAGVVANFNCEPLHYEISPTLIVHDPSVYSQANIKLEPLHSELVLSKIESIWKQHFPEGIYEAKFLTDQVSTFYSTESRFYSVLMIFAGIAIAISCMGLFGVASFVSLRRVREISIRKVLGATSYGILRLLTRQFLKPVVIAIVIAIPAGSYAVQTILKNYAYKITVTWDLFAIPFACLIMISILTVFAQTMRASLTNPANQLKSE